MSKSKRRSRLNWKKKREKNIFFFLRRFPIDLFSSGFRAPFPLLHRQYNLFIAFTEKNAGKRNERKAFWLEFLFINLPHIVGIFIFISLSHKTCHFYLEFFIFKFSLPFGCFYSATNFVSFELSFPFLFYHLIIQNFNLFLIIVSLTKEPEPANF